MIADDPAIDPKAQETNYGTLNRKELISMLKSRYGNDMEKYKSLKRVSERFVYLLGVLEAVNKVVSVVQWLAC